VVDLKEKNSSLESDSDLENNKQIQIIDDEPTSTIVTTKIQPEESKDLEEG
jgi:hypothetical protein